MGWGLVGAVVLGGITSVSSRSPDPSPFAPGFLSGRCVTSSQPCSSSFRAPDRPWRHPPVLVPAIALIAITRVAKTATGWIACAGLDVEARLRAGTALIAHGEFSIVIAGLAVSANFDPELAALAARLVLGTALLGPLAAHLADDLARLLPPARSGNGRPATLSASHFGRFGPVGVSSCGMAAARYCLLRRKYL
jgi:hypothetical protein